MIDAITFDQPELWDARARATVELAALVVGTALSPYTGLEPAASFAAVFGHMRTWFTPSLTTYAKAEWSNIKFQCPEVITLTLVVHEMGHLFGVHAKNKPTKQLWLDRFTLDTRAASPWPGMHPPFIPKYNIVEQFVNAWEVWVLGLYDHDARGITPVGKALRAWMDAHMGEWCKIAIGG